MRAQQGFTLIELLVTMGIVAVLLGVMLNLQSGTISYTEKQGNLTQRLQAISDVSGYVGDRVKTAQAVPDGLALPDGVTATGTSTCSLSGAAPCLAVVLPVVEASCGQIINWRLHAFRYVPRSSVPANEKAALGGLDVSGVFALKEIRVPSGLSDWPCSTPMTNVPASFTGTSTSGVIADNLVLPAGTARAFEYTPSTRTVTLRFRSVTSGRTGTMEYTPSSGPYTLQVFARNVN